MANRIFVCGGNGAGKSTLGRRLAIKLHYPFADIEDYCFQKTDSEYPYKISRTKQEVSALLLHDMENRENLVVAAVKGDYGDRLVSLITHVVYIDVPKEIRIRRVKARSYRQFGDRMRQGGDLYEEENRFFNMVERRSEQETEKWLDTLSVPIVRLDGLKSTDENVDHVIAVLQLLPENQGNP
ncbi:MAG: AAA family ATPase [Eubacteriales bacterium]|nr:AAA family ATPase [Eubacteriales bacterium]